MSRIVCIDTWIEFHMWSGVLDCLYRNILTKVSQGVVLIKDNLEFFFGMRISFVPFVPGRKQFNTFSLTVFTLNSFDGRYT